MMNAWKFKLDKLVAFSSLVNPETARSPWKSLMTATDELSIRTGMGFSFKTQIRNFTMLLKAIAVAILVAPIAQQAAIAEADAIYVELQTSVVPPYAGRDNDVSIKIATLNHWIHVLSNSRDSLVTNSSQIVDGRVRIDLNALSSIINTSTLNALIQENGAVPYQCLHSGAAASRTMRLDWLVSLVMSDDNYNRMLGLGNSLQSVAAAYGFDPAEFANDSNKVIVRESGIALVERVLDIRRGGIGISSDFKKDTSPGIGHLKRRPLENPTAYTPDAHEVIFKLPNGLDGYFLSNGNGQTQEVAPSNVVDYNRMGVDGGFVSARGHGPEVQTGRDCLRCHRGGFLGQDFGPVGIDSLRTFQSSFRLGRYIDADRYAQLATARNSELRKRLKALGAFAADPAAPELPLPLLPDTDALYRSDLSIAQMARELDVTAKAFSSEINWNRNFRALLGVTEEKPTELRISRSRFTQLYCDLLAILRSTTGKPTNTTNFSR